MWNDKVNWLWNEIVQKNIKYEIVLNLLGIVKM